MGFDDWLDFNDDGDVSGMEAFLGLGAAGSLGYAIGADEAQYVAQEKRNAQRKNYEHRYQELEDERDELLEENKRLKKKLRSSYWDDEDDWVDEDDDWDDD